MRVLLSALPAAAILLGANAAAAQSDPAVALGVNVGTSGVGVEAQIALGPIFTLRGSLDRLNHSADERYDDIDYSGELAFNTMGGFVDLHPFANGLLISGGAYVGDRDITLAATPSSAVQIGGQTYTPAQVGTLSGSIKLQDVSPFVGIGWDDTFYRDSRWGFRALVGVAVSEEPEVVLSSTGGSLSNDAAFQARLQEESRNISDDAEGYGLFPVIQVGLNYKF